MMKNVNKFLFALALGAVSFGANAQDDADDDHQVTVEIPSVALLDLHSTGTNTNVALVAAKTSGAQFEAGLPVDFSNITNSEIWLNYSSLVAAPSGAPGAVVTPSRNVTVGITGSNNLPTGVVLKVSAAAAPTTNAGGTLGTPGGAAVTLSTTAVNLITGIGSAYTGDGANQGHNLTYTADFTNNTSNYAALYTATYTVTVEYTIVDN